MAPPDPECIHFMGWGAVSVLDSFPVALLVSTALGFLAGLGVGGGSLLILWLTLVLQMVYPQARLINLLFFLPAAVISTLLRRKQGTWQLKKVLPAILTGCVSAGLCAWLSNGLNTDILKKFLGVLLLVTGIRELLYKPKTGQN